MKRNSYSEYQRTPMQEVKVQEPRRQSFEPAQYRQPYQFQERNKFKERLPEYREEYEEERSGVAWGKILKYVFFILILAGIGYGIIRGIKIVASSSLFNTPKGVEQVEQPKLTQEEQQAQAEQINAEAQGYIDQLRKIYAFPDNETPTVAVVKDAKILSSQQSFYKQAKNGDVVCIFARHKLAVLMRPTANTIIAVTQISVK
jgi:hypothetical protein